MSKKTKIAILQTKVSNNEKLNIKTDKTFSNDNHSHIIVNDYHYQQREEYEKSNNINIYIFSVYRKLIC